MARPSVAPIDKQALPRVGEFLHTHLNPRLTAEAWAAAACAPWSADAPNHGFMLLDGDEIVGVYLAFYSAREIDGRTERFCNLAAWCVLPGHRLHSITLLRALLAQPGYHFTDLSPSGNTVPVNERLKFVRLDTTTSLLPNLPWPLWPGAARLTSDVVAIERALTGPAAQVFRDHRHAKAARHVLITAGEERCYVVFRHDRRKNLPLFASVLYVSNPALFRRHAPAFGRHLLLKHGVLVTLVEHRLAGGPVPTGIALARPRPKMFRSDTLSGAQIDNLYSELVCVAW